MDNGQKAGLNTKNIFQVSLNMGGDMQKLSYHFLKEKTISCIIEVRPNLLICVSQNECKYILIELLKFQET